MEVKNPQSELLQETQATSCHLHSSQTTITLQQLTYLLRAISS